MGRGYPSQTALRALKGASGIRSAVAVATQVGSSGRSLSGVVAGIARAVPKIGGPPPAMLIGFAGALALGYLQKYIEDRKDFGPRGEKDFGPFPVIPFGGPSSGQSQVLNPNLVYITTQNHPNMDTWVPPHTLWGTDTADAVCGNLSCFGVKGSQAHETTGIPPKFMRKGFTITQVNPGQYYAITREVKFRATTNGAYWYDRNDVYRNMTAVPEVPRIARPPRHYPPAWAWRGASIPEAAVDPYNPPFKPEAIPDRGIGILVNSITGSVTQTNAMTQVLNPGVPELKTAADRRTAQFINQTLGQIGEAIDVTRCFMKATGNTYVNRNGVERPIPKRYWADALSRLASGSPRLDNRQRSVRSGRNIITPSGKVITPEEFARDFVECVIKNHFEDMSVAARSKFIQAVAGESGFSFGPLGIQSLLGAAQGGTPYDGLLDLNLS